MLCELAPNFPFSERFSLSLPVVHVIAYRAVLVCAGEEL